MIGIFINVLLVWTVSLSSVLCSSSLFFVVHALETVFGFVVLFDPYGCYCSLLLDIALRG